MKKDCLLGSLFRYDLRYDLRLSAKFEFSFMP